MMKERWKDENGFKRGLNEKDIHTGKKEKVRKSEVYRERNKKEEIERENSRITKTHLLSLKKKTFKSV